jgi:hypothetical protein
MKCPSCDLNFKSYTAVSVHFRSKHGTSLEFKEIMRLKLIEEQHGGVTPVCKCGCGQVPKYYDYDRGYVEYVRGHQARVKNNWGHNEVAQKKSQDVRRGMHERGEITIWNKGETKETDKRVAELGRRESHTLKTNAACQIQRAKHMSEQWKSGSITPLTGSAHSQWKGGVSSVQQLSRSYVYNVWAYPKLLASSFTCQRCGSKQDLCVHHDQERFAQILQKAREVLGDVTEDFASHQAYAKWIADYHLANNVSGIALCSTCHELEHEHVD